MVKENVVVIRNSSDFKAIKDFSNIVLLLDLDETDLYMDIESGIVAAIPWNVWNVNIDIYGSAIVKLDTTSQHDVSSIWDSVRSNNENNNLQPIRINTYNTSTFIMLDINYNVHVTCSDASFILSDNKSDDTRIIMQDESSGIVKNSTNISVYGRASVNIFNSRCMCYNLSKVWAYDSIVTFCPQMIIDKNEPTVHFSSIYLKCSKLIVIYTHGLSSANKIKFESARICGYGDSTITINDMNEYCTNTTKYIAHLYINMYDCSRIFQYAKNVKAHIAYMHPAIPHISRDKIEYSSQLRSEPLTIDYMHIHYRDIYSYDYKSNTMKIKNINNYERDEVRRHWATSYILIEKYTTGEECNNNTTPLSGVRSFDRYMCVTDIIDIQNPNLLLPTTYDVTDRKTYVNSIIGVYPRNFQRYNFAKPQYQDIMQNSILIKTSNAVTYTDNLFERPRMSPVVERLIRLNNIIYGG